MPTFDLSADDRFILEIDAQRIEFIAREHPNAPGIAHAIEGGKATVYRVTDTATQKDYALKVMKQQHRDPALTDICQRLRALSTVRGLAACDRVCLTDASSGPTVRRYPDLRYAILMQWITGRTWFDTIRSRGQLRMPDALRLGLRLASVLDELEGRKLSHCDIAGGNVIFDPTTFEIELIDVEDVYGPGFERPRAVPLGTQGYQHRKSAGGQWSAEADRFAGAVMLAEMLGWYDHRVRDNAWGETYFEPGELQDENSWRYPILRRALEAFSLSLGILLERAWRSIELAECPSLAEWQRHLETAAPPDVDRRSVARPRWVPLGPVPPPPPPPGATFLPLPIESIASTSAGGWTGPIAHDAMHGSPPFWKALPVAAASADPPSSPAQPDPTDRRT